MQKEKTPEGSCPAGVFIIRLALFVVVRTVLLILLGFVLLVVLLILLVLVVLLVVFHGSHLAFVLIFSKAEHDIHAFAGVVIQAEM